MTFKDFLRILRRRIVWFGATAAAILAIYLFMFFSESRRYAVSAKITITAPKEIALLTQSSTPFYGVTEPMMETWRSRVRDRAVQEEAFKIMRSGSPSHAESEIRSVIASASVTRVGQTYDALITVGAPTPQLASDAANALALAIAANSKDVATREVKKAIDKLAENIRQNETELAYLDGRLRRLQEDARTIDPERKTTNVEMSILALEDKITEVQTQSAKLIDTIGKIHGQKALIMHLEREFPVSGLSLLSPFPSTSHTDQIEERIYNLRIRLNELRRRYQPKHPDVVAAERDIKDLEVELTSRREEAIGTALDKQEFDALNERDLLKIELKSLQSSLEKARGAYDPLAQQAVEYRKLTREYSELFGQNSQLVTIIQKLSSFEKASSGYVNINELSFPKDAAHLEKQSSAMFPFILTIAIIIGTAIAYLVELLDTTIKTDFDVKRHLNYPLLGTVPFLKEGVLLNRPDCNTILLELFDTVATMLSTVASERMLKVVVVTSANPKEGKSSISVNIATALAKQGRRVVIVDGDLRIPAIHAFLNVPRAPGLAEALSGGVVAREMLRNAVGNGERGGFLAEVTQASGIKGMSVIPCGEKPENPYELFESSRLSAVFQGLKAEYDFVIVDSPPLLLTGDALKIVSAADAALFVIESGKTDQKEASWAKHLLTSVGVTMVGTILNKASASREQYYRYYYHYGYHRTKR